MPNIKVSGWNSIKVSGKMVNFGLEGTIVRIFFVTDDDMDAFCHSLQYLTKKHEFLSSSLCFGIIALIEDGD